LENLALHEASWTRRGERGRFFFHERKGNRDATFTVLSESTHVATSISETAFADAAISETTLSEAFADATIPSTAAFAETFADAAHLQGYRHASVWNAAGSLRPQKVRVLRLR
jgi:hypothetical protein